MSIAAGQACRNHLMGTISTGIGLVSGINSAEIIDQLMELERRPILNLQGRIQATAKIQLVFTELSTRLGSLKSIGTTLRKPSTFDQVTAASSDETVLRATALPSTPEGSYSFRVARLVQSQQVVSGGFATADASPVGTGTISLELGDARLSREASLDELNAGAGVRRGTIQVVDRQGRMAHVDLTDAVTLQDVADRINATATVDVTASVEESRLVITNRGGGTGNLRIQDVTGHTAEDLGILADAASDVVTGGDLVYLGRTSALADLNDGRGVANGTGDGMRVTLADGSTFDVLLSGASSLGDVIDGFNTAAAGKAALEVDPADGHRLRVRDTSGGGGQTSIAGLNGSSAAADLGLEASAAGGVVTGGRLIANYGSVLTASLLGGSGLPGGQIQITDAAGGSATVDLTGVQDVSEILEAINDAAGANVRAQLNNAGNGIDLIDTSGGTGALSVTDLAAGTLAQTLGWAGDHVDGTAGGANLQRAWLTSGTSLTALNGGKGVDLGRIRITTSAGQQAAVDFRTSNARTVGDLLKTINTAVGTFGVTARINDNGDGILLEDTAGGGSALKVEDMEGGTAQDLRLAGESADGVIDGSFEVRIDVSETDSLEDVREKINDLGFAARAEILNAGGSNPFRLSLTAREGGERGAFVFDAGETSLSMSTMSQARDAAVFVGAEGAESPLLVTSGSNDVKDIIPGLTLHLERVSDTPTTVSVRRDVSNVVAELGKFVESFNALRKTIDDNSKFNEATGQRGVLLGEPVVGRIERQVYGLLTRVFESGNPKYRILADIGLSIGSGATLELDEEKFQAAWADDPEAVRGFFTATATGFGHLLQEGITTLTDPVDGVLTRANETLNKRTEGFEEQIERLEVVLAGKRLRLERQFADLETALSRMQFQQQQIGAIQPIDFSPNKKD